MDYKKKYLKYKKKILKLKNNKLGGGNEEIFNFNKLDDLNIFLKNYVENNKFYVLFIDKNHKNYLYNYTVKKFEYVIDDKSIKSINGYTSPHLDNYIKIFFSNDMNGDHNYHIIYENTLNNYLFKKKEYYISSIF